MKILILNGPNLQLLGSREPEIYGKEGLEILMTRLENVASRLGCSLAIRQSNHEGDLVDWLGNAPVEGFAGVIINPAAYTHTSVAIRDAIAGIAIPVVEVHLSNVQAREEFRSRSLTAPACVGVIAGFGGLSYELALRAFVSGNLQSNKN